MNPTTKNPTKCRCGQKNDNGSCKNCSRVKMVPLLHGPDLKKTDANGKKVNPVYYSFIKNNNQPVDKICNGMYRRFMESNALKHVTRKIHFYDNETKKLIGAINL